MGSLPNIINHITFRERKSLLCKPFYMLIDWKPPSYLAETTKLHPQILPTAQAQPWFSQNLGFSMATRWERKLKMETQVPEMRCSKVSNFRYMLCLGIYVGCPPPTSWVKMEISRQSQFLYPIVWWPNVGPLGDLIHLIVLSNFQTQNP